MSALWYFCHWCNIQLCSWTSWSVCVCEPIRDYRRSSSQVQNWFMSPSMQCSWFSSDMRKREKRKKKDGGVRQITAERDFTDTHTPAVDCRWASFFITALTQRLWAQPRLLIRGGEARRVINKHDSTLNAVLATAAKSTDLKHQLPYSALF